MTDYPKWVYLDGDGIIVDNEEQHEEAKEKGFGCHGTVTKTAPEPVPVIALAKEPDLAAKAPKKKAAKKAK